MNYIKIKYTSFTDTKSLKHDDYDPFCIYVQILEDIYFSQYVVLVEKII